MPRLKLFRPSSGVKHQAAEQQLPRILFVSHEATRTGAPQIILNLLKHFRLNCEIECETILHEGGPLLDEFACYSEIHPLDLPRRRTPELRKRVRSIVDGKRKSLPIAAICNSMESRFIVEQLGQLGVPVISLVHELPCSYSESDYQIIFEHADKIVFPVKTVRDSTHRRFPIPFGKDLVLPQGLLDPDFGRDLDPIAARQQIREELSLPTDAFVVLGCGSLDLRKGIDHFANTAIAVSRRDGSETPIHFVWVGDGPRWSHSPWHYVQVDLRQSNCASNVHFIGEREDVAPWFVGSDLFLLSSRVDPFPCVVHEAMASRLPVIAFEGSGGATDALRDGAGFQVQFGDYASAAGLIRNFSRNPAMAEFARERSLERVHSEYRFDLYAHDIISLTESLAGRNLREPQAAAKKSRAA